MAGKRWSDLDPKLRTAIIVAATGETVLKAVALADIRRRPSDQIRGRKPVWALGMLINSAGVIPVSYFLFGRRKAVRDAPQSV